MDGEFKVAVIGGGISGASAVYYLKKLFNHKVTITLFEKTGRIGGRIKTLDFMGEKFEAGASIFHSSNKYMMNFARDFGLKTINWSDADERILIFDKDYKPILSTFGGPSFISLFKVIRHFGWDIIKSRFYILSVIQKFKRIYNLQDNNYCFTTPAKLFNAMSPEFPEMTTYSHDAWMKNRVKLGERFRQEFAFGAVSNNYCQGLNVHAFVGLISLAGSLPKLYGVEGGNEQIPQRLVQSAIGDENVIHATVQKIEKSTKDNKYNLTYENHEKNKITNDQFDYVIISVPLNQNSQIISSPDIKLPSIKYQEVDHGFFAAELKPNVCGIIPGSYNEKQLLALMPSQSYYEATQINPLRSLLRFPNSKAIQKSVWLSYSEPKLMPNPQKTISDLFFDDNLTNFVNKDENNVKRVENVRWLAYPLYAPVKDPHVEFGKFELYPGLYYVNAIELFASCMEISIIGARNVALLIAADREKKLQSSKKSVQLENKSFWSFGQKQNGNPQIKVDQFD